MSLAWIPKPARWPLFLVGVAVLSAGGYAVAADRIHGWISDAVSGSMAAHEHVDDLTTGKALRDINRTLSQLADDVAELHDVCVKRGDCPPRTVRR